MRARPISSVVEGAGLAPLSPREPEVPSLSHPGSIAPAPSSIHNSSRNFVTADPRRLALGAGSTWFRSRNITENGPGSKNCCGTIERAR
jgi:hypothetical protein